MVTMAQTAANWLNTHTHLHRTHSRSHTYINTVTTLLCEAPAQLLQTLESNVYFEGTFQFLFVCLFLSLCLVRLLEFSG